jgi:hypothetical protein
MIIMRNKRGQAALEFLMTYGWAILVVLIAIGALAYFGVLNPSRFLPSSCVLFPGLSCTDFIIGSNNVLVIVRNGMGEAINGPVNLSIATADCGGAVGGSNFTTSISDGQELQFNISCAHGLSSGSRFKADLTVVYNSSTSGLQHTRTGQVVGQVE